MRSRLLHLTLIFLLGGGVGFLLSLTLKQTRTDQPCPPCVAECPAAPARADRREERPSRRAQVPPAAGSASPVRSLPAQSERLMREENRRLQAQLEELGQQLQEERELRREVGGVELSFPEQLPESYRQEELLQRFQEAFAERELAGQITGVDCAEFPCVVYGELKDLGDLQQLQSTEALASYQTGASLQATTQAPDGSFQFGLAFFPRSPDLDFDSIEKRFSYRSRQLFDTVVP